MAETLVTGPGQQLTGYGVVNTVNGDPTYGGSNYLYFVLNYTVSSFTPTVVTFNHGTVNLFLHPFINLLNQSSSADISLIQSGTSWATLAGHDFNTPGVQLAASGALTGATLSFTGAGLLDVISGAPGVFNFLNTNNIGDNLGGFADIAVTTSGNNNVLNTHDNTTGCTTGRAVAGQFCFQGSADLRGSTNIPEPGIISLVGLGLLGMGAALRKRKSA